MNHSIIIYSFASTSSEVTVEFIIPFLRILLFFLLSKEQSISHKSQILKYYNLFGDNEQVNSFKSCFVPYHQHHRSILQYRLDYIGMFLQVFLSVPYDAIIHCLLLLMLLVRLLMGLLLGMLMGLLLGLLLVILFASEILFSLTTLSDS